MGLVLVDCKRSHSQAMRGEFHDRDAIVSAMLRACRV
jgi:hypothetical protein